MEAWRCLLRCTTTTITIGNGVRFHGGRHVARRHRIRCACCLRSDRSRRAARATAPCLRARGARGRAPGAAAAFRSTRCAPCRARVAARGSSVEAWQYRQRTAGGSAGLPGASGGGMPGCCFGGMVGGTRGGSSIGGFGAFSGRGGVGRVGKLIRSFTGGRPCVAAMPEQRSRRRCVPYSRAGTISVSQASHCGLFAA